MRTRSGSSDGARCLTVLRLPVQRSGASRAVPQTTGVRQHLQQRQQGQVRLATNSGPRRRTGTCSAPGLHQSTSLVMSSCHAVEMAAWAPNRGSTQPQEACLRNRRLLARVGGSGAMHARAPGPRQPKLHWVDVLAHRGAANARRQGSSGSSGQPSRAAHGGCGSARTPGTAAAAHYAPDVEQALGLQLVQRHRHHQVFVGGGGHAQVGAHGRPELKGGGAVGVLQQIVGCGGGVAAVPRFMLQGVLQLSRQRRSGPAQAPCPTCAGKPAISIERRRCSPRPPAASVPPLQHPPCKWAPQHCHCKQPRLPIG